jgi:membrane protease YdiL (CAAX protease family)
MTRSRTSHELIWGALIGALFLWGSLFWHLGVIPSVTWIVPQWPMFFALCVASPVLEEYVFRGFLYEAVDARWPVAWPSGAPLSISLANALTTFLFVTTHMIAREPMAGALVLLPSIYLGLLRQRYGGAGICMLIHAVWNVGWFSVFPPI